MPSKRTTLGLTAALAYVLGMIALGQLLPQSANIMDMPESSWAAKQEFPAGDPFTGWTVVKMAGFAVAFCGGVFWLIGAGKIGDRK